MLRLHTGLSRPHVALCIHVHECGSVCAWIPVLPHTWGCARVYVSRAPLSLHKSLLSDWRSPQRHLASPTPTRWSSPESHKAEREEQAGLSQSPGPPPHTAAEAPAGHGLDPALWTSLTLASDLNIWQQADKGCSGNSLCGCQQPHPLHCPVRGLHIHTPSASSSGPCLSLPSHSLLQCVCLCPSPISSRYMNFSLIPSPWLSSSLLPPPAPPHSLSLSDHLWVCYAHFSRVSFSVCLSIFSISVSGALVCLFLIRPPGNRPGTLGKSPLRGETLGFVCLGREGGAWVRTTLLLLPLWVGLMAWDHLGWA